MIGRIPVAFMACLWAAGCAGGGSVRSRPFVEAKGDLYVSAPAVPAEADSLLAGLGWGPGKFSAELRKELRYQLNRSGVATSDDTAAKARLEIAFDKYDGSEYSGKARLTTPSGSRDIPLRKPSQGRASHERDDPTVDNIRFIAETVAPQVKADPRRAQKKPEPFTGMIMLF
jgi:hypothetical protein